MKYVIIQVDDSRRIIVYKEGGLDLECYVADIGWVLDNDADIADHVLESYLEVALNSIDRALGNVICGVGRI